ncbi:MAG: phosphatidate cytidylyltransferase [Clostridia bacterium]|nr:phosphatidate cytidylyltransferase [Clostridia bacterium]
MNPVLKRVITALVTASAVVCALLFLPLSFVLPAMLLLVALVHLEFCQIISKKHETMTATGIAAGMAYLVAVVYMNKSFAAAFPPIAFFVFLAALFSRPAVSLNSLATTVLGILYIPVMLSFFLLIPVQFGMKTLLYIIAIIKISDMGGFAFGKAFGKHKMCPSISPKKSWEGLLGSIFASCLISAAFIPLTSFSVAKALIFGVAAAVVGTLGDLVESRFKREAEVKDSATFMPAGMGGFLDMFDSLIFAPAIFYQFL